MNEHAFGYLEHTADKGVIGYGDTLEAALENTAYGMFSLMAELPRYTATEERPVEVSGGDDISVLKAWLEELVFIFEVDRFLPVEFHVVELTNGKLRGRIRGRPFGPDIEWLGPQVKAVTYHEMKVEKIDDRYRVQAIVDV